MTDVEMARQAVGRWKATAEALARDIWSYAELPYCETKSAAALCGALEREGFSVETHVAGIPTCFTAVFRNGTGTPVVGLLAEFDALDGLSQRAAWPEREAVTPGGAGHGCGHNLLGAGCFAAAMAIRDCLVQEGLDGSVVFFGCPAEEGAGSKQFMARAGCFDGIDFALTWHPGTWNQVPAKRNVAIMGGNFTFDGVAAHAGGAPHLGRSALDAAELMNVGVNFLREHMSSNARIHYAFLDAGGRYANVVQEHTKMLYQLRAPKMKECRELLERVEKIAQGAAMMTETEVEMEIDTAVADVLPNYTLERILHKNFEKIGMFSIDEEDKAFAEQVRALLSEKDKESDKERIIALYGSSVSEEIEREMNGKSIQDTILPYHEPTGLLFGSTDVGDVSQVVPTAQISTAGRAAGTPNHSWMVTMQGKRPLLKKSAIHAGKIMAAAAIELLEKPEELKEVKKEFIKRTNGEKYQSILPEACCPYKTKEDVL